jgi:uncharacterized protein
LETFANDLYGYFKDFFDLTFRADTAKNSAQSIHDKFVKADSKFHNYTEQYFSITTISARLANSDAPSPAWDSPLISNDFNTDLVRLLLQRRYIIKTIFLRRLQLQPMPLLILKH